MRIPCVLCKGRFPDSCGRTRCPILERSEAVFKAKKQVEKKDFFGSSPAPFVGRFNYPNINVGVLIPPETKEEAWLHDAPRHWAKENYQVNDVIGLRSNLVNSSFKASVKDSSRFLDISQEVGMASKPVEMEVNLDDKPRFRISNQPNITPMGPNAKLKKAQITQNPKIDKKVDKVVDDVDLKATQAIDYLYSKGFDENFLTKLLSVANLGVKANRKLVPTRWSITAVDDALGRQAIKQIKDYKTTDYLAYFGGYLGNYYLILMFPDVWSYELFETYMPKADFNPSDKVQWTTDYEPYAGRKQYANNTAGGYYAARLPILDRLKKLKRQASVLALRFITGEYYAPLGVWVVREATRKSVASKPIEFSSKELMLKYAEALVKRKFGYDVNNILKESVMLKNMKTQKKLVGYF